MSGERRSCETARSSAGLDGVGPAQRRRLDDPAEQRPRARAPRSGAPRAPAPRAPAAGAGSPPRCRRRRAACPGAWCPRAAGRRRVRSSPSTASISIAAELSSSACARRAAAVGSASARLFPRSSSRAISAARSASRRRSLGVARAGARDLGDRARERRRRRGTRPARPSCSESWIVKLPDRRQVEEVERGRAQHRRGDAQPRAPGDRHDQHRGQVDDAQRDHRRDVLERIDDQRAQRDRERPRRPRPRAAAGGSGASRKPNGGDTNISLMDERDGSRLPPRSTRPARFGAPTEADRASGGRCSQPCPTVPVMIVQCSVRREVTLR